MTNTNQPEKKFTYGSVSCAVWNNTATPKNGEPFEFKTVSSPTRNYKDKDNKWNTTSSLRKNDIANAIMCLQDAQKYINTRNPTEENTK